MGQISLLDEMEARARSGDPETSQRFFSKVREGTIRAEILIAMYGIDYDKRTSYEIAKLMNKPRDHVSPHMKPLEKMGFIEKTKHIFNDCEVWNLTDHGVDVAHKLITTAFIAKDVNRKKLEFPAPLQPPSRGDKKATEDQTKAANKIDIDTQIQKGDNISKVTVCSITQAELEQLLRAKELVIYMVQAENSDKRTHVLGMMRRLIVDTGWRLGDGRT
jgi:DNA-binding MarR family transcriptional regulator